MDIRKNIASILQLYEFSMSIGKSLDYQKNCDNFLTLLLARKNLTGCCILQKNKDQYEKLYSYPTQLSIESYVSNNQFLRDCFSNTNPKTGVFDTIESNTSLHPKKGSWVYFSLHSNLGLFLFENSGHVFSTIEINQLQPIISKFSLSLQACTSFSQQESLLKKLTIQNRKLKEYTHVVSHDLKSPLRTINTLITWIKEDYAENINASVNDNLDKIDLHIEKMDNLINGILEYSVVDERTQNLKSNIDMDNVIKEMIELIEIPDHITIDIPRQLPTIYANLSRIKQLFQNLITNAIKAIDKEKGEVCVLFEELPDFWQFGIKDNGKGIPEKYHKKVFEIFQKLETNNKSTGIGLSIVKKIVAFYEGKIWIESQEGIGTTFFFTLKK